MRKRWDSRLSKTESTTPPRKHFVLVKLCLDFKGLRRKRLLIRGAVGGWSSTVVGEFRNNKGEREALCVKTLSSGADKGLRWRPQCLVNPKLEVGFCLCRITASPKKLAFLLSYVKDFSFSQVSVLAHKPPALNEAPSSCWRGKELSSVMSGGCPRNAYPSDEVAQGRAKASLTED